MELRAYLGKQGLDDHLCSELIPLFVYKEYGQGTTILHMGENTSTISLILKGVVRGYFLDEKGNDVTKCFSKEGDWCCCYNFLQINPLSFSVETLEDCLLAQIEIHRLREMIEKYPIMQAIYEKLFRDAFMQVEDKGVSFQRMTAKERYCSFIEKYPEISQRVKQEYIASYLGITPSSLSRIKRGL